MKLYLVRVVVTGTVDPVEEYPDFVTSDYVSALERYFQVKHLLADSIARSIVSGDSLQEAALYEATTGSISLRRL